MSQRFGLALHPKVERCPASSSRKNARSSPKAPDGPSQTRTLAGTTDGRMRHPNSLGTITPPGVADCLVQRPKGRGSSGPSGPSWSTGTRGIHAQAREAIFKFIEVFSRYAGRSWAASGAPGGGGG